MPDAHSDLIRLDTLGALLEHGRGLFGRCQDCAATDRPELLPEIQDGNHTAPSRRVIWQRDAVAWRAS